MGAAGNLVEGGEGLSHFDGGENADGLKRSGPGTVDGDFVRQKAAIERKRALEGVEMLVGLAVEAAAPEAVVFARSGSGCSRDWDGFFPRSGVARRFAVRFGLDATFWHWVGVGCRAGAQRAAPLQDETI